MSPLAVVLASIAGVLAALAALLFATAHYFYLFALEPRSRAFITRRHALPPNPELERGRRWLEPRAQHMWIRSQEGLLLHACRVEPPEPAALWVICLHGYTGRCSDMAGQAQQYSAMGYGALLPDLRGHGSSQGEIGMGWPDRRDLLLWIRALHERYPAARIALHGVSMGAATVMMASGEPDLPPYVTAVIEDCGYTSVWEMFACQLRERFHLPRFPLLYLFALVHRVRSGFWIQRASALRQVARSHTPTLFIHGDADELVPFSMLDRLYAAAACPKERLAVPGSPHAVACAHAPGLYWTAVRSFLSRYAL